MSHKTLYIDIDEEITSIVDRIRKAEAREIIVVAPKRALLLQSLVNLKLLKKEADRRKKRVMIVTQDKVGKKLIEKAGILVQGKVDDTMADNEESEDYISERESVGLESDIARELEGENEEAEIGSDEYFDEPIEEKKAPGNKAMKTEIVPKEPVFEEKKTPKEKRTEEKPKKRQGVRISDIVAGPKQKGRRVLKRAPKVPDDIAEAERAKPPGRYRRRDFSQKIEAKADKYFGGKIPSPSVSAMTPRQEKNLMKTEKVKGKAGRYFFVFAAIFVALGIVSAAYFLLPKARLTLYLSDQEKPISSNVVSSVDTSGVEKENKSIPAILEQVTKEKKKEFDATGSKSGSGAGKSAGKVVIYNEFSSENQPLVATTRLETGDGKIFRITKNTVVPGMTKVGAEVKPGAIEVDVVADKAGAEYNIEPATFKIPGFKGGPKYEKFYAKSTKAMSDGGGEGAAVVSSQDVAGAKEELGNEVKKEAAEELARNLSEGRKIFEDMISVGVESASVSENVGAQTEKFNCTVKVKAKTLSFSEDDVKELLKYSVSQEGGDATNVMFNKPLNYILAEENIEKGYVKFEAKTDIGLLSDVDISNFKRGILGKDSEKIQALAKSYPAIKKVDVSFWPFFVKRVPLNEKRVTIEIK